jgi:hypothetical protein
VPANVNEASSTFESAATSATELFVVPKSMPATLNLHSPLSELTSSSFYKTAGSGFASHSFSP